MPFSTLTIQEKLKDQCTSKASQKPRPGFGSSCSATGFFCVWFIITCKADAKSSSIKGLPISRRLRAAGLRTEEQV